MSKYSASKITAGGQQLLMQCLSESAELQFTRMAFGDGVYSADTELVAQNDLKSERQSVSISSISIKNNNSIVLSSVLSNVDLSEGYRLNEIGLFAKNKKDPLAQEILYAICIAEEGYADYLPPYNGYAPTKVLQDFYIEVADASNTTILVDDTVTVSKAYLESNYYTAKKIDEFRNDFKSKIISDKRNIGEEGSEENKTLIPSIAYLLGYYYDFNDIDDMLSKKLDYKGIICASNSSDGGNFNSLFDEEIEPGVKVIYNDGYSYLLMTFRGVFSTAMISLLQISVKFRLDDTNTTMSVRSGRLDIQSVPNTATWNEWQDLAFKAGES